MSTIVPCIWLDDQAESAADFYVRTFPGGRVTAVSHYPASTATPTGKPPGSVLTVEFEVAGRHFTALNGGPLFRLTPNISFFVHLDTVAEVERLAAALLEGGTALMPLDTYPWSERYAWVEDRCGVSWQVIAGRRPAGGAVIVPCLMFAGTQHGRAAEAARVYTSVFPGSRIDHMEPYGAGEGPEGTVKHGRIVLGGHEFVVMDGHVSHDMTFSEALSLQVMCRDQEELDRYWDALAEGGEHGPCGWLKDRFGLSWQVVPTRIVEWLTSGDTAARDRVFAAMLQMQKLDIAALQRAFEGGL
jgi:predicted 3-demethylubiquinone-9 3-methyltransferase (glyoxalase superfamily)